MKKNQFFSDLHWIIRFAITGKQKSPPFWQVASIIGLEETIERLQNFINLL